MSQQQDLEAQAAGAQEPHFAAFVAIDWADQKHVWATWLGAARDGRTRQQPGSGR